MFFNTLRLSAYSSLFYDNIVLTGGLLGTPIAITYVNEKQEGNGLHV